jgi:FkbM family methyltransferase
MREVTLKKIRRRLELQATKIISRVLFLKRGASRDALGSFISPLARSVAYDAQLHELLVPVMDLMTTQKIEKPLIRLGSEFDGGYLVVDQDYADSFLISAGISNNNEFEMNFAGLGGHGHQVDYTIVDAPKQHPNLTFKGSRIVGEASKERKYDVTLDEVYINYIQGSQYQNSRNVLKMDIEGSEWDILNSSTTLHKFDQILIELHYLEKLAKKEFQELYLSGLNKLLASYFPISIAGNNCCGFVTIGGFAIPRYIEMTLANRSAYRIVSEDAKESSANLITRNYSWLAPVVLKRW